ncbi:hypothetical protein PVAG01_07508 [Phlyctema vagabunda]|uniref:Cytochrome P450 n=1 Tax=Phlyctema vagabunda TaxID=108571 RepID=A0ABR4PCM0_9HELO
MAVMDPETLLYTAPQPVALLKLTFSVLTIYFLFYLAFRLLSGSQHPQEPITLSPRIPILGHLLGFISYRGGYFERTKARTCLPNYTMRIFSIPTYVISSPRLVSAVQRNNQTLKFDPLIVAVSDRVLKIPKSDLKKMEDSKVPGATDSEFSKDLRHIHHRIFGLGSALNAIQDQILSSISTFLTPDLLPQNSEVDLYTWNQHILTMSASRAIWGMENPFENRPDLEHAFWLVEENIPMLLVDLMPRRAATEARDKLYNAFSAYYRNKGDGNEAAPDFIRARKNLAHKYMLSDDYTPRADIGELMAMLFNVVPTNYWMISNIFSRPTLLAELRKELESVIQREDNMDSAGQIISVCYIDAPQIRKTCPLLVSTFKEVLRMNAAVTTTRYVLEDTIINDDTFLRKGGMVQIPGGVMHFDGATWGPDAHEFNPSRFIKPDQKIHPTSFRPFGGGATICPGRRLAMTQILSFTAALICGYDIRPKSGRWYLPKRNTRCLPGVLKPAVIDCKVNINRRTSMENVQWRFRNFGDR